MNKGTIILDDLVKGIKVNKIKMDNSVDNTRQSKEGKIDGGDPIKPKW